MRFYVTIQGSVISKEGDRLLVKKDGDVYHTIFLHKLEQLLLFGNINLTPAAIKKLFKEGVDTVFLSKDGRFVGRFNLEEGKNFFLRKRQFYLLDEKDFILSIARSIVKAKLFNMVSLLMRIGRTKGKSACKKAAYEIRSIMEKLDGATSVESIRGYEGKGSSIYFSVFSEGLLQDFGFRKRVRRPPTDPVNSVLSLLYTFLFNRVYSAIRVANLDPYPGNLHSPDYGRYALVMDLMEEFRVIIADTLCLSLFNLGILKGEDFVQVREEREEEMRDEDVLAEDEIVRDRFGLMSANKASEFFDVPEQRFSEDGVDACSNDRGKLPVVLKREALKRVISSFEKKLQTEFYYEPLERRISYEKAILEQARQYRRVVEGELSTYVPLTLK